MNELIHDFVCRTTFSEPDKISNATKLFDEGIFDSMGLLNLITFLEENFKIKIEDSELDISNFGSIDSIVSFIGNKLSEKKCVELLDI